MYSKILNMTMINTNPNPEYDMAKNTLLIESTIPLDIADANKIIGQNSSKSDIKNSNIKVVIGTLQIDKSQIKQSIFLNDHGDIEFKNMPSKVDAKASTKQGDIRFKYDSKPEDTILKLNPGTGDSVVKNKTFTNGKVGKSDNVLEFYTIDGNIKVE